MILVPTVFRIATAFSGMVAVVFGVLDHEDVVLQGTALYKLEKASAATPAAADPSDALFDDSAVIPAKSDSGTEGTFRTESYHFRFTPTASRPVWPQVWSALLRVNQTRFEQQVAGRPCQGIVGITVLRV
jgi:hypothetical protein